MVNTVLDVPQRGLHSILGELTTAEFLTQHFGQRFALLPGRADRFAHLLSWQELNHLMETQTFTKATLRMKKGGADLPIDSYLSEITYQRPGRAATTTRISAAVITRELRDGATLIINQIQRASTPIAALAEDLERSLDARVNVNMYASLHNKHGFGCHWDNHDVLVLQVQGRKHWQVFGPRPLTPLPHETFDANERMTFTKPAWDGVITEGDALYLPRGWWHFAEPIGEPTLHLSVGIVKATGIDFLQWLVQRLGAEEAVRKDIPRPDGDGFKSYIDVISRLITSTLSQDETVAAFLKDRAVADGERVRVKFGLPWSATESVLPPSLEGTIHVTAPHGLRPYPSADADDSVQLYAEGKPVLTFRRNVMPLCDFLMAHSPISLAEFIRQFESQFDGTLLLGLLRELAVSGLIVIKTGDE
jgi:ribosomal protein L16 Arg81 hydroxylase